MAGRDPLRCKENGSLAQANSGTRRSGSPDVSGSEPAYQTPNCAVPKNDKQDELCQQWRAARAADEAACVARWQFWISLAAFGGLLATVAYTAQSARAAAAAASAIAQSERAFVKMSHASPGVTFDEAAEMGAVKIHLKNYGRTPADVLGVCLGRFVAAKGEAIPAKPAYIRNRGKRGQAFLVADDEYWLNCEFPISKAEIGAVQSGAKAFYILGYVDYRDRMGNEVQRGGTRGTIPIETQMPIWSMWTRPATITTARASQVKQAIGRRPSSSRAAPRRPSRTARRLYTSVSRLMSDFGCSP